MRRTIDLSRIDSLKLRTEIAITTTITKDRINEHVEAILALGKEVTQGRVARQEEELVEKLFRGSVFAQMEATVRAEVRPRVVSAYKKTDEYPARITVFARYELDRRDIDEIINEIEGDGHQPTISRLLQAERELIEDQTVDLYPDSGVRVKVETEE